MICKIDHQSKFSIKKERKRRNRTKKIKNNEKKNQEIKKKVHQQVEKDVPLRTYYGCDFQTIYV